MQLNMLREPLPFGTGAPSPDRAHAYAAIALYEAVVQGMPAYRTLSGQLNSLPSMPSTQPGQGYHWGACANAALAEINRRLFPTTADSNLTSMNQLELRWKTLYATQVDAETLQRSIDFGKEVAIRIATWAASDGSSNVNPPYIAPTGFGLWIPTTSTPAVYPYSNQRRLMVPGVTNGTTMEPLPPYSTDPASPFFAMVKDVYDKSLVLTPAQIATAVYFRDSPGYPTGGHFICILWQILSEKLPALDIAALVYAKAGIAQHEATVILFTKKYTYNIMRPVTYIQTVMGYPNWNTVVPTPNHPEFPSGHSTFNGASLSMFANVFGDNYPITLHTYDYLNLPSRSYTSFTQMGIDMAMSRVWGGLHYQATADRSLILGKKIAQNVLQIIDFLK
jgi:membrane-associated phospholipid phosphatase